MLSVGMIGQTVFHRCAIRLHIVGPVTIKIPVIVNYGSIFLKVVRISIFVCIALAGKLIAILVKIPDNIILLHILVENLMPVTIKIPDIIRIRIFLHGILYHMSVFIEI